MANPQGTLQVLLNRDGIVLDSSSGLSGIATKITKIGGYVQFVFTNGTTYLCAIVRSVGCKECLFYNTGKCPRPQGTVSHEYTYCCSVGSPCAFVRVENLLEEL